MSNTDVAMPELLPCPFCGAHGSVSMSGNHSHAWEGGCSSGDCIAFDLIWEASESEAITAWNRRAIQQAAGEAGEIVVTKTDTGAIVSVTRQDAEGRILDVIAQDTQQAAGAVPEVTNWTVQIMENYEPRRLRLTIGVQSFDIDVDDEDEGCMEWYRDMLTKAMTNATAPPKQQLTQAQMERIWGVYAGPGSHPETITRAIEKEVRLGGGEVGGVPQWQPIETAPKDGTMILLGRPESEEDDCGPVSTAGRWQEGWEDSIDDMGCDDGFVDVDYQELSPPRSFGAEKYRSVGRQPTHWMPLPPPPAPRPESPTGQINKPAGQGMEGVV